MKRRDFITLLGGAAVALPFAARAQQGERVRRIVFLHSLAENDPEVQARIAAFRQGLEALGWREKRNVQIEHRFSRGDIARMQAYTAEVVSSAPDLIVATSSPVTAALGRASGSYHRAWPVGRYPIRGAVARDGVRHARRRRDRVRRRGIRARVEWRRERDGEHVGHHSSRADYHAGGPQ